MKKIKQFIAVFLVLAMSITGIELSGVKAHAGLYDYYYRAHCDFDDAHENSSKEWGSFFYNGVFYDVSKWDEDRRDHKIVIPGSNEHAFEYDIEKKELHVKGSGEIHIDNPLVFNVDIDGMTIIFDNPLTIKRHYKSEEAVSDILCIMGDTTIKTNGKVEFVSVDYVNKTEYSIKSCGIWMRDSRDLTFEGADIEITAYEGIHLESVQTTPSAFNSWDGYRQALSLSDHTEEPYKKSRLDIKDSNIDINCTGKPISDFSNEISLTDCYFLYPENVRINSRSGFRSGEFASMSDTIYWIKSDSFTGNLKITNRYPVWLGENQVSMKNYDAIPGVHGGTASYDPVTKTLTFDGDVTGFDGIYEGGIYKAMIYAEDDLTIKGNINLEDNTDECCGIVFDKSNGTLTIDGNVNIKSKKYGLIDTHKDSDERANLVINGNVEAGSENSMLIFGNVKVNPSASITVEQSGAEEIHNGVFETNKIIVDGGSIKATATKAERVIHCDDTFSISTGYVEAVGQYNALKAENGFNLSDDVKISVPDGATISEDGIAVMDGENVASTVKIVPVTYNVTFDVKGHGTAPATQTVIKNKMAAQPEDLSEKCQNFGGWFTDETFASKYNFSSPVKSDITLYAKWTTEHTPAAAVIENVVPVTCTTDGSYDEVVYCSVCETELSRTNKTVTSTGHVPAAAVRENEVAATCTTDGSYDEVVYCLVCNAEISRTTKTVTASGHTPKEAVKEKEVAATCTTDGSYDEVVYCSTCGAELSRTTKTVTATGHISGDWEVQTPATETTDGTKVKKCQVCGAVIETETIPATGKTAENPIVNNGENKGNNNGGGYPGGNNGDNNGGSNPGGNIGGGEINGGNQGGNSSENQGSSSSGNIGGNTVDNPGEIIGGGSSSSGSSGRSSGGSNGGSDGGSFGGNIGGETSNGGTVVVQPSGTVTPTSTPVVEEIKKGSVLKDSLKQNEYIVTSVNKESPEVAYHANLNKSSKSVSIPKTVTIGGVTYKVTSIYENAFKNNNNITKVIIGTNVTSIEKNAFYGCTSLKNVSIPKTVKIIETGAFRNCSSLKKVTIGTSVTKIGSYAFSGCSKLTELTIPKNVKTIGKNAFNGCNALKKLTIKTRKLTSKSVSKGVFNVIPAECKVIIPADKEKSYKKLLVKKGLKNSATISISKNF